MRIPAILLQALLVAACGTPVAATPSAVSVASPIAGTSPVASPAVEPPPAAVPSPAVEPPPNPTTGATPTTVPPTAGGPATVTLLVTACATSTGADEAPPSPPAATEVTVATFQAGRVGIYGDGYDLVMAPLGWSCEAQVGADGSTSIRVWSPDDAHAQVTAETNGGCYGCALILACPLFASASQQYAVDFGLCDPQRPAEERVAAETAELIAFTDPPGVAGTGTGSGGAYQASGLVWYSNDGDAAFASRVTCALAPADGDPCGPVLDFVRSLLPTPPPGSSPAEVAALVPPAP